jgi:hypothetical protein
MIGADQGLRVPRSIGARLVSLRPGGYLRKAAAWGVLLLVWACVVLPAGSIAGVNVKFLLFGLAAVALVLDALTDADAALADVKHLLGFALAVGAVLLGFIVALLREVVPLSYAIGSLQGFLATIGVAYLIVIAVARGTTSWQAVIRAFLYAVLAYSFAKIGIVGLVFVGLVDFAAVRSFFREVFDYSFVSMLILPGLVRIQFVNDVTLPFALMALSVLHRPAWEPVSPLVARVMVATIFIAVALAFSRWLFFLSLVVAVLWLLLFAVRRTTALLWVAVLASLGLMAAVAFDLSQPFDALVARFTSPAVEASDAARVIQIDALLREIARGPLLGRGLGAYAPDVIQRASEPYSYEVQWLAILLQLGVLGTSLLLVPLLGLVVSAARVPDARAATVLMCMTGLWLVSGFTNPYLISSTSGVVFGVLAILALGLRASATRTAAAATACTSAAISPRVSP